MERNALTHQDHLQSLHESTTTVRAISPKKRKIKPDAIMTSIEVSLCNTLICGLYTKRLLNQQYEELDDGMATLLNEDWSIFSQMHYACSRLLAGIILLDTLTGKSVIVNSVEIFGRRRSLDAHRESFRV